MFTEHCKNATSKCRCAFCDLLKFMFGACSNECSNISGFLPSCHYFTLLYMSVVLITSFTDCNYSHWLSLFHLAATTLLSTVSNMDLSVFIISCTVPVYCMVLKEAYYILHCISIPLHCGGVLTIFNIFIQYLGATVKAALKLYFCVSSSECPLLRSVIIFNWLTL